MLPMAPAAHHNALYINLYENYNSYRTPTSHHTAAEIITLVFFLLRYS
jgi:hypothetical protein